MRVPRKAVVAVLAVGGLAVVVVSVVAAVVAVAAGGIAVIVVVGEIGTKIGIIRKANRGMDRSFPVRLFVDCLRSHSGFRIPDSCGACPSVMLPINPGPRNSRHCAVKS